MLLCTRDDVFYHCHCHCLRSRFLLLLVLPLLVLLLGVAEVEGPNTFGRMSLARIKGLLSLLHNLCTEPSGVKCLVSGCLLMPCHFLAVECSMSLVSHPSHEWEY